MTLPKDNIDTDQIIPARFVVTSSRIGFGEHLFADWRFREDGSINPSFVLNRADARSAQVLVGGKNFGCGSSREHAPWALRDFGFRAVISSSIADIFKANCSKNGVVPAVVSPEVHARLLAEGSGEIFLSLDDCTITTPGTGTAPFRIDAFARACLLEGLDELSYLLGFEASIERFEHAREAAARTPPGD